MAHFVLVPGTWLGAWVWDRVTPLLREGAFEATAVTLSGLSDRSDIPAADVGLETHVADIVAIVEAQDLDDVILVGHGYAGIPVGQAATRLGERVKRVVYLDASVPREGRSLLDNLSSEERSEAGRRLAENDGCWPTPEPEDLEGQDLNEVEVVELVRAATPHPGRTLTEPARLATSLDGRPTTYVRCLKDGSEPSDDVKELLGSPSWELRELDTGHWPMSSKPHELAALLAELA